MSEIQKFRQLADLTVFYGCADAADPVAALKKALYRAAPCGVWVEPFPPGSVQVGSRKETWTATIRRSIIGSVCVRVRKKGQKSILPADAPRHVREYLLLDPDARVPLTWEEILALTPNDTTLSVRLRRGDAAVIVTFVVQAPTLKRHAGGIRLGAIVEGEPLPQTLYYPFTEIQLGAALIDLDTAVDDIITYGDCEE
jgi:hypothetical protein